MHNPAYRAHVTRCAALRVNPLSYAQWADMAIRAINSK